MNNRKQSSLDGLPYRTNKGHWNTRDIVIGLLGLVITIVLAIVPFAYRDELTNITSVTAYGLIGMLAISFIAASAFSVTAIPVPYWAVTFSLPSIMAARYGIWAPVLVGVTTAVGASAAQFLTFIIGYTGRGLSDNLVKKFGEDFFEKAVGWIKRHGGWAVFLMSVTTNPLHLPMTIALAALHYPPWTFLAFSFLGMLVKSLVLAFAGYYSLDFLLNLSHNPIVIRSLAILGFVILLVALWQIIVWLTEIREKNRKYRTAIELARKNGKELLVIGGPWGVLPFRRMLRLPSHPGGDVCIDVNRNSIEGTQCPLLASFLHLPFKDGAFGAIYVNHGLEHLATVADAESALNELRRVADNVFVACSSRQSIASWLTRSHHLSIWEKYGLYHYQQRRVKRGKKQAVS
jgi:membrane protein DedA with SNARE-associated domain